eukprot:2294390-Prymnesium_polylepis.1
MRQVLHVIEIALDGQIAEMVREIGEIDHVIATRPPPPPWVRLAAHKDKAPRRPHRRAHRAARAPPPSVTSASCLHR